MSKKSKTKSKMRLGQRILLIVAILMLLTGVGFLRVKEDVDFGGL